MVDVLNAKPVDSLEDALTITRVIKHVNHRIPLISAGQIRTPDQAERALALGLPLIAIGKALVMNPNWIELAKTQRVHLISTELQLGMKNADLHIPDHLWQEIKLRKGWFPIRQIEQV